MRIRRALSLGACVALVGVIGGCTAASSSQTVSGKTLSIYLSAPTSVATNSTQQDILYAEELAFCQRFSINPCKGAQFRATLGPFSVQLVPVVGAKLSDNARSAISDKSSIAYLGEVAPGSSADTIGITNAQDLLQVSPTDTAAALTQTGTPIKDAPKKYYESLSTYGRTFARVAPTTTVEAQDLVRQMQATGVTQLYIASDGSDYGRTIAQEVMSVLGSIKPVQSASGADAMLYAGGSESAATSALAQAVAANPKLKLFAPSALADPAFVSGLSPSAQKNLVVSEPGFLASALNPDAKKFVSDFSREYGHAPETQAVFGYAAMNSLITVLSQAGTAANNRGSVVRRFLSLSNLPSVVGPLTLNGRRFQGDSNITAFVFSRVKAGKLVPFKVA